MTQNVEDLSPGTIEHKSVLVVYYCEYFFYYYYKYLD
jgi:hypothetical protein